MEMKTSWNQTLQYKSNQKNKCLGYFPCKILWTLPKLDKGENQTDGQENKEIDDKDNRPCVSRRGEEREDLPAKWVLQTCNNSVTWMNIKKKKKCSLQKQYQYKQQIKNLNKNGKKNNCTSSNKLTLLFMRWPGSD